MPTIIPPSRTEATFRALGYVSLGLSGIWVIFLPPIIIEQHLNWLTYGWGACLLASFVAAVGSYKRRYRIEYMSLPLTIVGVLIYAYTIWAIVPHTPSRGTQALFITAVVCILLVRFTTVHRLVVSWKGKPWIGSLQ